MSECSIVGSSPPSAQFKVVVAQDLSIHLSHAISFLHISPPSSLCLSCPMCDSHVSLQNTLEIVQCESLRSPGRLSPGLPLNFLPQTSPDSHFPPPSPPLDQSNRGYSDLLEAGYYNPQDTPPDYPPSPGLAATVGVEELPDERLDSLHCIPLDPPPSSPQPVIIIRTDNRNIIQPVVNLYISMQASCSCRVFLYVFPQPALPASPESSLLDPLPTYYDMSTSVSGRSTGTRYLYQYQY